jgi:hypothetical protein
MAKNMRVNKTIGTTPYTLMYGQVSRTEASKLPYDKKLLADLKTEADLEKLIGHLSPFTNKMTSTVDVGNESPVEDSDEEEDADCTDDEDINIPHLTTIITGCIADVTASRDETNSESN